jgi:plastocyanin
MNEDRSKMIYVLGIIGVVVLVGGVIWLLGASDRIADTEEPAVESELFEFEQDAAFDEVEPPVGLEFDDEGVVEGSEIEGSNGDAAAPAPSARVPAGASLPPVEVAMESGMFFFAPDAIRAKVGQKVIVHVSARGVHDFVIDELGVRAATPDGQTTRIEFTPTRAGEFEFYCSVGSHRQRGQVGTIVVEEA